MIAIRFALVEDADTIGLINYTSWQETYRGIVDDAYMDAMDPEQYKRKWHPFFSHSSPDTFLLVLETGGRIVGYCSAGKAREPLHDVQGEIYALYLLKEFQGRGYGKALWLATIQEMQQRGLQSYCVLVLQDNPAALFYRSFKPALQEVVKAEIGGKEYAELWLGWRSL